MKDLSRSLSLVGQVYGMLAVLSRHGIMAHAKTFYVSLSCAPLSHALFIRDIHDIHAVKTWMLNHLISLYDAIFVVSPQTPPD